MTNPTPAAAAATGRCPVCGHDFTSSAHQRPRRRYCSERCRKTAWRHRHPGHRSRPRGVAPAVPRPRDVPPAVPRPNDVAHEPVARCPHCARPVAVIALLVVPAAAQVTTPEVRHG
jgi:endogenous inhibitor of DNA gyrase (YacG/DUF329 family)